MEKRKLGNSGLEVAPLAFGGNVFGAIARARDRGKELSEEVEASSP